MQSVEKPLSNKEEARWRQNEAHGELLVQRLSRLVERGYRPIFLGRSDVFDLEHPHPKATPVQLWSDGQVVDRYPTDVSDSERTIIYPDDEALFATFLAAVPEPTPTQRLMSARVGDALMMTLAYGMLFAFLGLAVWLGGAIWHAMWGR